MKTTTDKKFDSVKFQREQREKLSAKLSRMSKKEIMAYFSQKKKENAVKPKA